MKGSTITAAILGICAAPVWAEDLAPRYEAIGQMTATIGEDTYEMVVPYDREQDSAYAEQKTLMGSLTINTVGQLVDADGELGLAALQVTLQEQFGRMALISAELFEGGSWDTPLSMGPDGGEGSLTAFDLSGDALTATVEGTFLRLENYMDDPRVAADAVPLPARIDWTVRLPPLDE